MGARPHWIQCGSVAGGGTLSAKQGPHGSRLIHAAPIGPQRDNWGSTMEPQGGPRTDPEIRESGGNDFLGGFGGKRPCPKASWVPYNPFPSCRIPCSPMANHFFHKTIFFRPPFLGKKGPRPSRGPNLGSGSQKSPPGLKIPKLRAEKTCRIQCSVFQTEPHGAS